MVSRRSPGRRSRDHHVRLTLGQEETVAKFQGETCLFGRGCDGRHRKMHTLAIPIPTMERTEAGSEQICAPDFNPQCLPGSGTKWHRDWLKLLHYSKLPPSQNLGSPAKKSQGPTLSSSLPFGQRAAPPLPPTAQHSPQGPHRGSSEKHSGRSGQPRSPFETGAVG